MQNKMDKLIKESLMPMYEPDNKLNQSILCSVKRRRKNNMIRMKKIPFAAAVAVCVLCIGSGTVYAAVQLLRGTTAFEYGISTNTNTEEKSDAMFDSTNVGDVKDSQTEILLEQEGDSKTAWLSKEVQQVTEYVKESDDTVNWTEKSYLVDKTIYTFADYNTAVKEAGMDKWFLQEFQLMENVTYAESVCEEEGMNIREISAVFEYGKGHFELSESKDLNLGEEDLGAYMLITNEITDSQKYMSALGYEFTIGEDVIDGVNRFSVAISYENYTGSLVFYNMTEDEMYQVLDEVQIK